MSFLISEGRLLNTTLRMWSAKEEGATTKYYMTGSLTLPAQQFFYLIFPASYHILLYNPMDILLLLLYSRI